MGTAPPANCKKPQAGHFNPNSSSTPTDFGLITKVFHPGSLINFTNKRAKGLIVDAEQIAAIKERNPDWQKHEAFNTYCDDFARGRIRRPRGRPKQRASVRYMVASVEYPVYLRLLQRWRRQGRRDSMLAKHYSGHQLSLLDDCHAAAEIVRAKFRLPFSSERFLVKMSEERHGR
jgi:hypothetical protein